MADDIAVSICCMTYNQVDYVADALESFLCQKTTFPYEIIINDDCSTDGTTEIVLDYAQRYPDLIRAYTHKENHYSKGVRILTTYLYPKARGRYLAFCEGDDYWTDCEKIQRQYDAMEAHPESPLCVHASNFVVADTKKTLVVNRPFDHDCILEARSVLGEIHGYATNSYFIRKTAFDRYVELGFPRLPAHGDFKMSTFFATMGPIIYLERTMSAYRMLSKNSINRGIHTKSPAEQNAIFKRNHDNRVAALRRLDEVSGGAFHDDIEHGIDNLDYEYLKGIRDLPTIKRDYRTRYKAERPLRKLIMFAQYYLPGLYRLVERAIYHI